MSTINADKDQSDCLAKPFYQLSLQDLNAYGYYLQHTSMNGFKIDPAYASRMDKLHETACRVHDFLNGVTDQDFLSVLMGPIYKKAHSSNNSELVLEVFGDELLSRHFSSVIYSSIENARKQNLYPTSALFASICSLTTTLRQKDQVVTRIKNLSCQPSPCLSVIRPLLYEGPYTVEESTRKNEGLPFIALCEAARSGQTAIIEMVLNRDPDLLGIEDALGFNPLDYAYNSAHKGRSLAVMLQYDKQRRYMPTVLVKLKRSVTELKKQVKELVAELDTKKDGLLPIYVFDEHEITKRSNTTDTLEQTRQLLSEKRSRYLAECSLYMKFLHNMSLNAVEHEDAERYDKRYQRDNIGFAGCSNPVLNFLYSSRNSHQRVGSTTLKQPSYFKQTRIAAVQALVEFENTQAMEFLLEELHESTQYLGALYAAIERQNAHVVNTICDKYGNDVELLALEIDKKELSRKHSETFMHDNYTPLMIAAEIGYWPIFKILYDRYCAARLGKQGSKVMSIAVASGNSQILKYVINNLRRKDPLISGHPVFLHLMTQSLKREIYPEIMEILLEESSINGNTFLVGEQLPRFSCLGQILHLFEVEKDDQKKKQLANLVQLICENDATNINGPIFEELVEANPFQIRTARKTYLECHAGGRLRGSFGLVYPFLREQAPVYLFPFLKELDHVSLQELKEPSLVAAIDGDPEVFKALYEKYKQSNAAEKKTEDLRLLAMSAAAAYGHTDIFDNLIAEYKTVSSDSPLKRDLVFRSLMTVALQKEIRLKIISKLLNEGMVTGNTFLVGEEYPKYSCLGRVVGQYEIEKDLDKKQQLACLIQLICEKTTDMNKPIIGRKISEKPALRYRQVTSSKSELREDKSENSLTALVQSFCQNGSRDLKYLVPFVDTNDEEERTYLKFTSVGLLLNSLPIVYPFLMKNMRGYGTSSKLIVDSLVHLTEPHIKFLQTDAELVDYVKLKYRCDYLDRLHYLKIVIKKFLQEPDKSNTYDKLVGNVVAQIREDIESSRPYGEPGLRAERDKYLSRLQVLQATNVTGDEQDYLKIFSELIEEIHQRPYFLKNDPIFAHLISEALSGEMQLEIAERLLEISEVDGNTVLCGKQNCGYRCLYHLVKQCEVAKVKGEKAKADKLATMIKSTCKKTADTQEPIILGIDYSSKLSEGKDLDSFPILYPFYKHLCKIAPHLFKIATDLAEKTTISNLKELLQKPLAPHQDDMLREILNLLTNY